MPLTKRDFHARYAPGGENIHLFDAFQIIYRLFDVQAPNEYIYPPGVHVPAIAMQVPIHVAVDENI